MNRRIIIFIIVLMGLALIALVGVQGYWVNNAMIVRQANFVRSVNEAVDGMSMRLEKIKGSAYPQSNIDFIISYPQLLDSLLRDELNKESISARFQFGVFSTERGEMAVRTKGTDPNILLEKGYAFMLFPGDLLEEPDYLMLFFPNERGFLIGQMSDLLTISVVLILVIIFSFTYTILTIYRQKRLSEMKNDFINNMTHEFNQRDRRGEPPAWGHGRKDPAIGSARKRSAGAP